jgi:hypothetical protein
MKYDESTVRVYVVLLLMLTVSLYGFYHILTVIPRPANSNCKPCLDVCQTIAAGNFGAYPAGDCMKACVEVCR